MPSFELGMPADLVEGFHRFRAARYRVEHERYRRLAADGQHPVTLVIACSDSRAAPETIFDASPGELFVVRNVAGLVPVYEPDFRRHGASAALEYGILALGVPSIVVLGHGRCGGIAAALDPHEPLTATDFVGAWVGGVRELAAGLGAADPMDPAEHHRVVELRSVEQSLANLRTFPWIRSREEAGTLTVAGAWFDIGLGELHALTPDGWVPLADG